MRLTPPKRVVFYLSVLFAAAGLIGYFVDLPFLSSNAFFLLARRLHPALPGERRQGLLGQRASG